MTPEESKKYYSKKPKTILVRDVVYHANSHDRVLSDYNKLVKTTDEYRERINKLSSENHILKRTVKNLAATLVELHT